MSKKALVILHIIASIVCLGFMATTIFIFNKSILRIIESGKDFGLSIAYYFCTLFGIETNVTPTVNSLPQDPYVKNIFLPENVELFRQKWRSFWQLWATKENFSNWISAKTDGLTILLEILLILLPLVVILKIVLKKALYKKNNDYDKDSKYLITYKKIIKYIIKPVIDKIKLFFAFLNCYRFYYLIIAVIVAINFNFITIILEAFAYYFYFVLSFDVTSLFTQLYKLILDLATMFTTIPLFIWIILIYLFLCFIRKRIGLNKLEHYENKNKGFINARPLVTMTTGTMGKGKTKAITCMMLSQEVIFRDKALELMLKNDMKFPKFHWIILENELKDAIIKRDIINLATCEKYINNKNKKWIEEPTKENIFNYDFEKYGLTYNNKIQIENIWDVINNYSKLYFIYTIKNSLIESNYSIRTDNIFADNGNFPLWDTSFFNRDSKDIDEISHHSHILDFNSLRIGKKVESNKKTVNVFEFGIVGITEIGKERGNTLELQDKKKIEETANQKNDLFNYSLKMARHPATIDGYPFVKIFTDEQRVTSWGADGHELADIIHINDISDKKLALPFFWIEEIIYNIVYNKFVNTYLKYRHNRGDNTLFIHIIKSITSKLHNYYQGIYNQFGYQYINVETENGTQDEPREKAKYYLMNKKIYSKRYSTDCYSDFFYKRSLKANIALSETEEYQTEKATTEELKKQNSYFINDMNKN